MVFKVELNPLFTRITGFFKKPSCSATNRSALRNN